MKGACFMSNLSLNPVVDVIVHVSPLSAPRRAFDTGLIIGKETVIPVSERLRLYDDIDQVAEDGFSLSSPEYLAAQIYFSQKPRPTKLMIGRRFLDGIATFEIVGAGSGYSVGNILSLTTAEGTGATFKVTTVNVSGGVTGVTLLSGGNKYSVASSLPTTVVPSGGTGCTISILSLENEPAATAVRGCREKNNEWYIVNYLGATKAEVLAIAAYVETATPTTTQFFTTKDADVPLGLEGNIFDTLKGLKYSRTLGQYSTKNDYAVTAIQGFAMRNNTGLANSCYTLKFKQEVGVEVDDLSATQVLNIENNNGNVYINRGTYYDMFEQGVMSNGQFFDEVLNLDMLSNRIQLNVMDKLYQAPKVPQTEAGVTQLVDACNEACRRSVIQGFLAPGKWTGQPLLNLNTGDLLANGYLVQSEPINSQDQADREARKAPPIYVAIKEAGAIHSVTIGVYVNR